MSELTLAAAIERLEAAYETARRALAEQNARNGNPAAPEEMHEASGRYILLDALTAIVQAKAALEASARPVGGVVVRPGDTLIVLLAADTSIEQFVRFREHAAGKFKEALPGVEVLYLGGGIEQVAVYRPEGEPA